MASFGLTVPSGRGRPSPRDQDHELRPQRLGRLQRFVAAFRGEDDLGLAVAVAKIDEQHAAVVAIGIDPAAQRDLLADMFRTKFAASMSPQQRSILAKKTRGCLPPDRQSHLF